MIGVLRIEENSSFNWKTTNYNNNLNALEINAENFDLYFVLPLT